MLKNFRLFTAMILLSSFPALAFAQQKYTSKYFPITKVINRAGLVIIECKPDHYNAHIRVLEDAKLLKGVPVNKNGYETLKSFKVLNDDSLTVFSRYLSTGKACGNISFGVKKKMVRVDELYGNSVLVYELMARTSGCLIKTGDMIEMEVINEYDDSLLLFRLTNYNITILATDKTILFPRQYNSSSPESPSILRYYYPIEEMSVIKSFMADLKYAATIYKTYKLPPITTEGPYAGKTPAEVFELATEKDIIHFLNYVASYPRSFMGNEYKLIEIYGTWIMNKQYPGTLTHLKIIQEYDHLVKMKKMELDFDKGTINGVDLKTVMDNWLSYFPVYDGDEKKYSPNANPYYQYNLAGNYMKYDVKEKVLAVWDRHQWINGKNNFNLTAQQAIGLLGKPAITVGDAKIPKALFFEQPYGTIHLVFDTQYGSNLSTYCTLHLVKPGQINIEKY